MNRTQWLAGLATLLVAATAHGTTLSIRPIDFGNGQTARGTITVADDTGDIVDWHLEVATVERLARYTPGNTPLKMVDQVAISGDGRRMTVATSPGSGDDGGILAFRARNPLLDVGTWIANFSGPAVDGGQALYMWGGNFEFLDLHQPPGSEYLVAERAPATGTTSCPCSSPMASRCGAPSSPTVERAHSTPLASSTGTSSWRW